MISGQDFYLLGTAQEAKIGGGGLESGTQLRT